LTLNAPFLIVVLSQKNVTDLDVRSIMLYRTICGRTVQDFFQELINFHGFAAPGLVLGGFLVDWARELVGTDVEADAIVETTHCLPDVVQLFTPCTVGNGWMKVLDWDKFALSLYDRRKLTGYRVWLDLGKLRSFPDLYKWYRRLVPKKDLPLEVLHEAILSAGRAPLSAYSITVTRLYERQKKQEIVLCPQCGEAYAASQGLKCLACQGEGYYQPSSSSKIKP
jgi:formylmethanofuran dehydrogenase subunit E